MGNVKIIETIDGGKIKLTLKWVEKDGKPKQKKLSLFYLVGKDIETKKINLEVKKKVDEIVNEKEKELIYDEVSIVRFPKLLDWFNECRRGRDLSMNTIKSWEQSKSKLELYLNEIGELDITTDKIDRLFLDKYQSWIQTNNSSKSTINETLIEKSSMNLYLSKLTCVIREGVKKGYFSENLTLTPIKKIKEQKKEVDYLTKDEIKLLIENPCKNETLYFGFVFALYTGMRISDICNLEWNDIDFDNNLIKIEQQKTKQVNYIPISKNLQKYVFDKWKKGNYHTELVFPYLSKLKISGNKMLQNWGKSLGIKTKLHFHIARHSFSINLIENDVDLYSVSKLLGHQSVSTTERHYSDITLKKKIQSIEKLNF